MKITLGIHARSGSAGINHRRPWTFLDKLVTMVTKTQAGRQQLIDELARGIAAVARELAETGLTADLAVARCDWDCLYAASERLLELQRRWAALYRRLLVVRVEPSRITERTSV